MPSRLLIISNRLPVTTHPSGEKVDLVVSSGGLATGLSPWHRRSGGRWIGWPGDVGALTPDQRTDLDRQLEARNIVPVYLSTEHIDRYYHGFANGVLWPLFHHLIDRVPVNATGWEAYRHTNERFADAAVRQYQPGDVIWVHDYQLMLLPALLRTRLPDARIGFFLHIPFPSSEIFRILPWRHEILQGLLGADLIGFHTFAYMRHFVASLVHIAGVEADVDRVRWGNRDVRLGAFPMGIDARAFADLAGHPDVVAQAETIRRDADGRRILLGIDRLDYTKGIPRRLQAVGRLLTRQPHLRDSIRYIQLAVPSRERVDSYRRFKEQVDEMVGRLNGQYGTLHSSPIHYLHASLDERQLVALYCAADVMLVTPLRDGMNLVAKEFLASRIDERGVLVLSEFAGAAAELGDAIVVNPYDVDGVASAILRALSMSPDEQRARMRTLRRRVLDYDVHAWADEFVRRLCAPMEMPLAIDSGASLAELVRALPRDAAIDLLLDYDGTLVPVAPAPELARPDPALLMLLQQLAAATGIRLSIVSGRTREALDSCFGDLPITLWAEHGFWHRSAPDGDWEPATSVPPDWTTRVHTILEQFTASTPGSWIEPKTAAVAWHYRAADPDFGERQAHELRMLLGDALSNQPIAVLEGKKVIELRLLGVSKAVVARTIDPGESRLVIAFGDDRTDEDLFSALPASSVTVSVGQPLRGAKYSVEDHRAVRRVLRALLAERGVPM